MKINPEIGTFPLDETKEQNVRKISFKKKILENIGNFLVIS